MTDTTKLPEGYQIVNLTLDLLDQLVTLQKIVIDALLPHEKNFMFSKTPEQLQSRMTDRGHMQGVLHQKKLVAYGGVVFPTSDWPVADMVLETCVLPCHFFQLAVIQSCAVHPAHRGRGIHKHLVRAKEELCVKKGKTHVMAEVAAANPASLKGFLDQGYSVIHAGLDPEDGCELLFVHKDVVAPSVAVKPVQALSFDPLAAFKALKDHLTQGYKGVGVQRNPQGYHLNLVAPGCVI